VPRVVNLDAFRAGAACVHAGDGGRELRDHSSSSSARGIQIDVCACASRADRCVS
jgi:hypothetical protein